MSEVPQLPPIPSLGENIKKNMIEKKTSVLKCDNCGRKAKRPFEVGDFVFRKLSGKNCPKCDKSQYTIVQVYGEWVKASRKERNKLLQN
ncbi:MAG: hypothetical protein ACTSRE_06105 [Promethearchaeota archaeon]